MKICIVTPYFFPNRGGFCYYLPRELSKMGEDVTILTTNINLFDRRKDYGVGWEEYENLRIFRMKADFFAHQAPFVKISKGLMKDINPDVVYTTEYFQPISKSASDACGELDIPFFFNQHAYRYPAGLFGISFRIYDRLIRNSVWKRTKSAMAISTAAKDFLLGIGFDKKVDVVTGGVDTERFKPGKGDMRRRLNIGKDTFVVLCVARLIPEKGVLKIPMIAKATEDLDIKYVVIGNGRLKERMSQMTMGMRNIEVMDPVPHDEIVKMYRDADLYIAPSDVEVLNYSVMEAMSCGLPVLASNVGGMKDLVSAKTGMLLPSDKIKVWVESIRDIYSKKLSFNKKSIVEYSKRFDWRLVSKRVLEIVSQ